MAEYAYLKVALYILKHILLTNIGIEQIVFTVLESVIELNRAQLACPNNI